MSTSKRHNSAGWCSPLHRSTAGPQKTPLSSDVCTCGNAVFLSNYFDHFFVIG